ncbi:unnamed protein product [Mesocestoides corti]|uniref:Dynein light chain n=1 Tax=Mesocestoides corti TaxID=53468 RepID=A0A0R3UGF2_MESCO|nr:unnamed protein product [Mesocestoides corti]
MSDGTRKAVVKNVDMSEEMQQDAIDVATHAFEKFNIEKDIAAYIKKETSSVSPKITDYRHAIHRIRLRHHEALQ